jgi:hypothetical protein
VTVIFVPEVRPAGLKVAKSYLHDSRDRYISRSRRRVMLNFAEYNERLWGMFHDGDHKGLFGR